jgi:hypothetical protein
MKETMEGDSDGGLAVRRPRRSTAGNRYLQRDYVDAFTSFY